MKTLASLVTFGFLAVSAALADDAAAKEQQRLQGAWEFVSVELNGNDSLDIFKGSKPVVKGNLLTLRFRGGTKLVRLFKLYPDTTPRSVDFLSEDGKEVTSEGIYELKDGQLKLLVNINDGVKDRPTSFAAKSKRGHILYVLKRD